MSETEQEREIEVVAGVIEGVTQKKPDTWQVEVKPEGSQYTKKLWTKDSELVAALTAKLGQAGAFVCGASYWKNQAGAEVRSLWINSLSDGTETSTERVATPTAKAESNEGMTPEKWDAKERRDYRSRAWAQTLGAFTHTIKTDEDPAEVFLRLQPFQRKVYEDVCGMFAYDPSLEDIPF